MHSDPLLDTHCHLAHYADPPSVLARSSDAGIGVVAVTNTPDEYRRFATRIGPRANLDVALGLHPMEVTADWRSQVSRLMRMAQRTKWIGEVGLDLSPAGKPTERFQRLAFEALISEPQVLRRPMSLHSRAAASEVVAYAEAVEATAIVLHWFTGGLRLAERAVVAGCYFSVNPAIARSRRGRSLVERLPSDRVLLETDGPYTTTAGTPTEPVAVRFVLQTLSSIWDTSAADTAKVIQENQRRLLGATRF